MVLRDEPGTLRAYLHERDTPCPGCGYNLRDLKADRCPECALELALRVASPPVRLTRLSSAVVGLGMGAGLGALVCLEALARIWTADAAWDGPITRRCTLGVGIVAFHALALGVLIGGRGWFCGRGTAGRAALVAACWALAGAGAGALALLS